MEMKEYSLDRMINIKTDKFCPPDNGKVQI